MDPLTHLAVPAALALALGARRDDAVLAGLGGLLPDLEKGLQVAFSFLPGSHYLLFKHGGTHTLLGAALLALSAALFVRQGRWRAFGFLLLGAWSQVVLDAVSAPWGVAPLLPFSLWRIERHGFPWSTPLQVALLVLAALGIGREVLRWRRDRAVTPGGARW